MVDAHQGFRSLTDRLQVSSKSKLFWLVGVLTFFLSAILNNLTVTIVMVSLMRKLLDSADERKLFGAMIVIAANAGGVWTPIGDVTTTMLWMNGQLSTAHTVTDLFLCSVVSLLASMAVLQFSIEQPAPLLAGQAAPPPPKPKPALKPAPASAGLVLGIGVGALLSVPVFVEKTGLPPFMGMLTGLGGLWVVTDALHSEEERQELQVPAALSKLDTSGILFFLGVLMAIGALDAAGLLKQLAVALSDAVPSDEIVAAIIGVASALIDNVPLVAATMGMYDMAQYPQDSQLWQLIAYCAGTGGSILVIGSASGVALMGLEQVRGMRFSLFYISFLLVSCARRTRGVAFAASSRCEPACRLPPARRSFAPLSAPGSARLLPQGGLYLVPEEGEPRRLCRLHCGHRRLPRAVVRARAPLKRLHAERDERRAQAKAERTVSTF